VAVLVAFGNGLRRGFWLSASQYIGLVAGVLAGATFAPAVADLLGIHDTDSRRLAALLVLIAAGGLGSSLGYWLGEPIRSMLHRTHDDSDLERWAGGAFSALAMLSVAWFLGLSFARGPSEEVTRVIQRSAILHAVDSVAPRPPGFLAGVERIIAGVPFPATFAGLEPILPEALPPPESVDTPGVQAAANVTVKVEGRGCSGLVTGSGYPVAPHYLVTNAHVVSGTTGTTVVPHGSQRTTAKVVLFDPNRDIAILYTPQLSLDALPVGEPQRGTHGAVIGYPGGGPEETRPAVVSVTMPAQGRDIYDQNLVERQIVVFSGSVRPGNSGGPLVDLRGRVLGLVFAASSSNPDQAYALSNTEVSADVQQAVGRTSGIDTQRYPCAV
jgi:S1-C subfamily serine protease